MPKRWQEELKALKRETGLDFYRSFDEYAGESFTFDRGKAYIRVGIDHSREEPYTAEIAIREGSLFCGKKTLKELALAIGAGIRAELSEVGTLVGLDVYPSKAISQVDPMVPKIVGVALTDLEAKTASRMILYAARKMYNLKPVHIRSAARVVQKIEAARKEG